MKHKFVMNKQYLKHSSPEIFGLLNENIFHLSFSDPVNLERWAAMQAGRQFSYFRVSFSFQLAKFKRSGV
jgi:hypothetical protein